MEKIDASEHGSRGRRQGLNASEIRNVALQMYTFLTIRREICHSSSSEPQAMETDGRNTR